VRYEGYDVMGIRCRVRLRVLRFLLTAGTAGREPNEQGAGGGQTP
jgi:hypothetical protein